MSYQTYIDDAATRNGAYAEPGSAAHHHYQNFYYPPPEVPAAEHSTQPASAPAHCQPASVSQWEYDPFSHSEHPPIPSDDDPPPLPPMDEAPPLPADDAPPLPSTPATIQDQPLVPPEQSVPGSQQQPAAYAEQSHTPAPQEAAFQPPNAQGTPTDPQPTWLAYQYPGMAEPQVLPQQDPWQQQQYQYASAYQAYSQATPVYQPPLWQAQAQVAPPWQQQQIPATVSQPQTQHPWQPQAPIQPQPPTLPAPVMPAPQPQAIPRVVHDISNILLIPGRSNRPKRVSIVLRGLPGSGKSYLAKKMKVVEVEQGGDAPRIHAIDDYFVTVRDASSNAVQIQMLARCLLAQT